MRKTLLLLFLVLSGYVYANHIIGGEMRYEYVSPGVTPNSNIYKIIMLLLRGDDPIAAPLSPSYVVAIYNNDNGQKVIGTAPNSNWLITRVESDPLPAVPIIFPPCIFGAPTLNYTYAHYTFNVELPQNNTGYTVVYQTCCRINGMINVGNGTGSTYNCIIPGSSTVPSGIDNSPQFGLPINVICKDAPFTLNFSAVDPDPGDSLRYSFCNAYNGGAATNSGFDNPAPPPYNSVTYNFPYSGIRPLGTGATINPATGVITGTAPGFGKYVVCVCIAVYRNGVLIANHRKDLIVQVSDCVVTIANPMPSFVTCNGFDVQFSHTSTNANTVFWDFGDPTTLADTAITDVASWHYADTGVFIVKFVINRGTSCADSVTRTVGVFPGFVPGFKFTGSCYTNPYRFTDTTFTKYGVVNSWSWNFGDLTTLADTSHINSPLWTYAAPGTKDVKLIVTNSKGCIDSITTVIDVLDKPALSLAFRDTLICRNDAVQLSATASGASTYSWSPPVNIVGANTATPTVSPPSDQWYYVDIDENGCTNRDSVFVRVVAAVTLRAINDTTICQGDAIQLNAVSNGLSFTWSPAGNLNNPNIINPIAVTNSPTRYTVVATIGGCTATDFVDVNTVPYPGSNAGPDPRICYNTSGQITGHIVGSSFSWSPTSYLNNPNILNPIASPPRTTRYILTVYDTLGCPKPGLDTVVVIVQPKIRAFAGNDTTVVVGQPLLFNGSGGVSYLWSPGTGLSSTSIFNPIGIYGPNIDSVRYKMIASDVIGCQDSAYVTVYVYKTIPYVFVPTAFTPNNDGLNDVIRPIAVGIRQINYFAIYNRWGERVFYTTANKQGWNGIHNGRIQASGVYVCMLQAIDYTGKSLFLKGTVTLIR